MRITAILFILFLSHSLFAQLDSVQFQQKLNLIKTLEKQGVDNEELGDLYYEVGIAYYESNNIYMAIKNINNGLTIFRRLKAKSKISKACKGLGKLEYVNRNFEGAIKYYQEATDTLISLNGGEVNLKVADSQVRLGKTLSMNRDYDKALEVLGKVLKVFEDSLDNNSPEIIDCLTVIAHSYNGLNQFDKTYELAEDILDRTIKHYGEYHIATLLPLTNLSAFDIYYGKYEKAESNLLKAIRLSQDTITANDASLKETAGLLYQLMGKNKEALEITYQSINTILSQEIVDTLKLATAYESLSLILDENLGRYAESLKYAEKSLALKKQLTFVNKKELATAYKKIASPLRFMGRNKESLAAHTEALNIYENLDKGVNDIPINDTKINISTVQSNLGKHIEALNTLNEAVFFFENLLGKNHPEVSKCLNLKASIHTELENYSEAIKFCKEALDIQHRNNFFYESQSRIQLATINVLSGDFATSDSLWQIVIPQSIKDIKNNFVYLGDNERVSYLNTLKDSYNSFYAFAFENGDKYTRAMATNLLINTKARSLDYAVSTSQLIQNIRDNKLQSRFNQLRVIRNNINQAEQPSASAEIDLFALNQEREQLSSEILSHPDIQSKLNQRDFTWKDARSKLKKNEAILDFVHYNQESDDSTKVKYAVVLIKKRQQPILIPLTTENDIQAVFEINEDYPLYLQKPIYDNAHELYKKLWSPLEPHLKNIKTIHLSPSGLLHRLDFDVLKDEKGEKGERLIKRYEFHYFNATRDFITKNKKSSSVYDDAVAMGHILYDLSEEDQYKKREDLVAILPYESGPRDPREEVKPLPYTLSEVKQLIDKCTEVDIRYNVLTRNQATEDTIHFFTGERSPSILHLATHGTYVEHADASAKNNDNGFVSQLSAVDNPLQRSVLMLYGANHTWHKNEPIFGTESDGILTAAEVALLDLKKTKLVTLSACKTGLGSLNDTEGVFGLQRAFKLAGADAILVSLWPVDDEATQRLMNHFYENLLMKKQKLSVALRNAKLTLRDFYKDGMDDQPNLWGGFILVE